MRATSLTSSGQYLVCGECFGLHMLNKIYPTEPPSVNCADFATAYPFRKGPFWGRARSALAHPPGASFSNSDGRSHVRTPSRWRCPLRHLHRSKHTSAVAPYSSGKAGGTLLIVITGESRVRPAMRPRATFAEAVPVVSPKYGRQTSRLSETVRLIGYVLGGEAGARLSRRLGMATSPDTVLRRLKAGPSVEVRGARALGVDDWAWRKGQSYGTILVDLESHAPIDLLPDRSADSLAIWLQAHPGEEVISRDRGGIYADGATRGAPHAIQVADRFHLLCNLTSAVERVLERKRTALANAIVTVTPVPTPPPVDSSPKTKSRVEQDREGRRQRRLDRYNEVVGLHRQGMSQQAISLMLHIQRKTVRRFLRAGQYPERATPHRRPPGINKYQEFLLRRWGEGCHNATKLWHEIQDQGYIRRTKHDG